MSDNIVTIPLTQGQETVIDAIDVDLANYTWYAQKHHSGKYYAARNGGKGARLIRIHREVMARKIGRPLTEDEICDHIDRNSLNNTRNNLRIVSIVESNRNRRKPKTKNGNRDKGIYQKGNSYRVQITVDGKTKYIGSFATLREAKIVRDNAILKYGK